MNLEAYRTDINLRVRQETHAEYTVGKPLEDLVDTALELEPHEALLDVGTANGAFPIRLSQKHTGRLVGLDFSSGMIALAKAQNTKVEFLEGDAVLLPFTDQSFDVVTARHMLYHVSNIEKALLEAKRVLKPNGRFLALTNADGYLADYWDVIEAQLGSKLVFRNFFLEHRSPKYFHTDLFQHIKSVFGAAKLEVIDQFLEFPNANAPLAYWNSMQAGFDIPTDAWADATALLEVAFSQKCQMGSWRIWKGIAFIQATLE